jgi:CTP:molybdopterin cytidylyltransferase MocA
VLALATGDVGARPYLQAHPDRVTAVECGDIGRPDDVDTPEDLARHAYFCCGGRSLAPGHLDTPDR